MNQKLNFIRAERPTTFSTTVKMDLRTLATLAVFWDQQGESFRSAAELLRLSLETFRDVVTKSHPSVEVTSSEEAIRITKAYGLADPTAQNRRNRCSLGKQLSLESSVLTGYDPTTRITKHRAISSQQAQVAARKLEEMESEEDILKANERRVRELQDACVQLTQNIPEATDE